MIIKSVSWFLVCSENNITMDLLLREKKCQTRIKLDGVCYCHRNCNETDKSGDVGNEWKLGAMITSRKSIDRADDGTKTMVMVLLAVVVLRKHKKSNKRMKSEGGENQ